MTPRIIVIAIAHATGRQLGPGRWPVGNNSGIHVNPIAMSTAKPQFDIQATSTTPGNDHPETTARPT